MDGCSSGRRRPFCREGTSWMMWCHAIGLHRCSAAVTFCPLSFENALCLCSLAVDAKQQFKCPLTSEADVPMGPVLLKCDDLSKFVSPQPHSGAGSSKGRNLGCTCFQRVPTNQTEQRVMKVWCVCLLILVRRQLARSMCLLVDVTWIKNCQLKVKCD